LLRPHGAITPFLPVGGGEGQYSVVLETRQSGRLEAYEEVPEAGDKPPVSAHADRVLTGLQGFFQVCRLRLPESEPRQVEGTQ
jgi:hypothetical protein